MSGDWTVEYRDRESIFLKKGPSGATGCLLLVLFLPLGLAYLLTDSGRGKLTARAWTNDEGDTELEMEWENAGPRRQLETFVEWLKEQEGEERDESADPDDEDETTVSRRRRKRRRL
ncbi:MAG: hypothetical protein A2W34_08690 [Chloroflexi bacterium RBG_16_64_32]|nr:MAG: hypothetical protein A2W34_08690 [Chloroflexi bacterium RBG_16_64_32]